MFDIEYKGANGVVISTKKTQIVVDPNLSFIGGLKNTPVKDAIELATEARFMLKDENTKLCIEGPGEYEIADVSIKGISATRHIDTSSDEKISTIYRIEIGDIKVALIGNVAPKLTEEQLEEIGVVDMVIIPVGGNGYTLDATSAVTIVRQIEPRAVVPIHYADSAVQYEVPQETLEVFTGELAAPAEDAGNKYKIKSSASLPQALTVITIARS